MKTTAIRRERGLLAVSVLAIGLAIANFPARAQTYDSTGVRAVPTYESAGRHPSAPGGTAATRCAAAFPNAGDPARAPGRHQRVDSPAPPQRRRPPPPPP